MSLLQNMGGDKYEPDSSNAPAFDINCNPTSATSTLKLEETKDVRCFLCREKDTPPDSECKVCQNIRTYLSKNELSKTSGKPELEDKTVNIHFPGPGIVKRNHIYGNYVVASRPIQPGELIIIERPLTTGPYAPPDVLPLCVSCYKDLALSAKCSKCRWAVCNRDCEKFYLHAENECPIFAEMGLKSKGLLNEYFSVETLRVLLLQKKNPSAWERVQEFEPHSEPRANDLRAKAITDFIANFIRIKCNLGSEFSYKVIDHVVGVLSVNTFWAFKDLNRYASCLFDKCTLFAHDCDPNTERQLIFLDKEKESEESSQLNQISDIALRIKASRRIEAGEMITIRYIDINQSFLKRREELKETFYFDCSCSRCLTELQDSQTKIEKSLAETVLS